MIAHAIHLISRFLLTPWILFTLGVQAIGLWALILASMGACGLHRMGFAAPAIEAVARSVRQGRPLAAQAALRTGASAALVVSLLVGGLISWLAPHAVSWIGTGTLDADQVVAAVRLVTLFIATQLVLSGYSYALEGLQEHAHVRAVECVACLVEAGLLAAALAFSPNFLFLAAAYGVRLLLPLPLLARRLRKRLPELNVMPGRVDRDALKVLLRFGGGVHGVGVLQALTQTIDRWGIATLLSVASAGAYELARKLVQLVTALPQQALTTLAPAATHLAWTDARGAASLRAPLLSATKMICYMTAVPLGTLAACAPLLVSAWAGADGAPAAQVLPALAGAAYFHIATGPATAALRGLRSSRFELAYSVLWLSLLAVLIPLGCTLGGLLGGAVGAAISQGLASLWVLYAAGKHLGVRALAWLRTLGEPLLFALLAAVPAWLAQAAIPWRESSRIAQLGWCALCACVVGVAVVVQWWTLGLSPDARNRVRELSRTRWTRSAMAGASEASA